MPAKRQYLLLPTMEPLTRSYIARALRNARRHGMRIVRQADHFYVFMTRSSRDPIVFAPIVW